MDAYQKKFELLMEVPVLYYHRGSQFRLIDTEYVAMISSAGNVWWYVNGACHTFKKVFDNVPLDIKKQLIFYMDLFI